MKTKFLSVAAVALAVVAAGFSSCKGEKKAEADSVAVEEVEQAVEIVTIPDSVLAEYNAAFFQDPEMQDSTITNGKYMVTSTGLKVAQIVPGTGKAPSATDNVTVHYTGRLTDGTVFDSSVSRGEPATFPLNAVIPGWTEGLQLMQEGGTTVFYLPSAIAYGERGAGDIIKPGDDLIFEVQLIKVN